MAKTKLKIIFLISVFLVATPAQAAKTSALWGSSGELYDPTGWLPDFSYAGYHAGEVAIPNIRVVANVKTDYGAKGDGVTDDSPAFEAAIRNMPEGALLVPRGKYLLIKPLLIDRSNVVLRGEGKGAQDTILYFSKGLNSWSARESWWAGKGGMVWVGESSDFPNMVGSYLTMVNQTAARGERKIRVSSTSGIVPGKYVVIHTTDNINQRSFAAYMMNYFQADLSSPNTTANEIINDHEWVVKVVAVNATQKEIELQQPLPYPLDLSKWQSRIYQHNPKVSEAGVENLRIEFPDQPMIDGGGVDGRNGIFFDNALNCWARDIAIKNYDNGLGFRLTKHSTAQRIELLNRTKAFAQSSGDIYAHHGFTYEYEAQENLITDFIIDKKNAHEFTLTHIASGNVARKGRGYNVFFDGHRNLPFANLFTDIDLGLGTSPYSSTGGPQYGNAQIGIYNTYWGNRASGWTPNYKQPKPYSAYGDIKTIVVPCAANEMNDLHWLEKLDDEVTPNDLYEAQIKRRTGKCVPCGDPGGDMVAPNAPAGLSVQ